MEQNSTLRRDYKFTDEESELLKQLQPLMEEHAEGANKKTSTKKVIMMIVFMNIIFSFD